MLSVYYVESLYVQTIRTMLMALYIDIVINS